MEKNYTVYKIEYQGKVMYIGKTCDFKRRVYHHKYYIGAHMSAIPTDVDLNEVTFTAIETFDNETDTLRREDELIQAYDTINTGWNKMRSGLVWSDKEYVNAKIREYQKTEKYKAKKREWEKTEKRKQRHQTPEYKAYQREWHKQYRLRKKAEKELQNI